MGRGTRRLLIELTIVQFARCCFVPAKELQINKEIKSSRGVFRGGAEPAPPSLNSTNISIKV